MIEVIIGFRGVSVRAGKISAEYLKRLSRVVRFRRTVSPRFGLAMILGLGCILNCTTQMQGQTTSRPKQAGRRDATAKVTGTDGSVTGIANFQGNFTAISADPGQALVLFRKRPNCPLSLGAGSYNLSAGTYTQTELTASYEQVLHSEAGLSTTPDVFAHGCAVAPVPGISAAPFAYLGTTTSHVAVMAGVGLTMSGVEGVYLASGTETFTVSSFAFSSAGLLSTADLNGDGNGDLVIDNNPVSGSGGAVSVLLGNARTAVRCVSQ